jgi:predicted phage terminase large subunit-like protein
VLIQTRWHEDDLAGRLLREHGERWESLILPAIAEVDDGHRKEGEALWPEKYSRDHLEQKRAEIGSKMFAPLYQQRPAAAEGVVFKRDWVRTYRGSPPQGFQRIIQSWDTAFKTGTENDYSVCTTWGIAKTGYYLLFLWRGRVEFPELLRQVSIQAAGGPDAILIEDNASGPSLIQALKSATRFPALAIRVGRDKRARAEAVTPLFEAGKVFVPESEPWVQDYIDELAAFPAGSHDDMVDSTTQALNYLRQLELSPSLAEIFLNVNSPMEQALDRDGVWEKLSMGIPITEDEWALLFR